jgi:XcyI restriction endonuclease
MPNKRRARGQSAELPVHPADLQIDFWAFLQQIRGRYLSQALSDTVSRLEIRKVDEELVRHAQSESLTILATAGLRGETFLSGTVYPRDSPGVTRIATAEAMPSTSIGIKGGTDDSNVHNRTGEAEKSQLKAKAEGFTRFWTIV